uniref:ATP synthase F0 subunit 8 n=1 Tax=Eupelmus anpingensis TaxID=2989843 RepID=A0A9E8AB19_9HYME|nr:ATP synthase F0 subunit 8 [Eupelmus anpingensis]UYR45773.1 ATP synthase F0 subunit 8 [Eupelmus anpingensis]
MPQMSPLLWMNLYLIMILLLILFMVILNSIKLFYSVSKNIENKFNKIYFKWFW